jgi:hypothetical protein
MIFWLAVLEGLQRLPSVSHTCGRTSADIVLTELENRHAV